MRWLVAAFILASSLARAGHEPGHGMIVVNAPDGPTMRTEEDVRSAQRDGLASITVMLENVGQIQDEDLLQLIELEIMDMLMAHGFRKDGIAIERCPKSCRP